MVVQRRQVWWADLGPPRGSGPGRIRPVVVVQSDRFNRSQINTIVCVVLTSNLSRANAPGNVMISRKISGLPKDSVANVSQIVTLDREFFLEKLGTLPPELMRTVEEGLRLILNI